MGVAGVIVPAAGGAAGVPGTVLGGSGAVETVVSVVTVGVPGVWLKSIGVRVLQVLLQLSTSSGFPSSHCSFDCTVPSPQ